MEFMELFYLLWFFVLPILGFLFPILAGIFWIFLVPSVSKRLAWARFRNVSIHAVADDSGQVELVVTKEELPEGIVRTKKGWHFLPRPFSTKSKKKIDPTGLLIERLALKTYTLKGLGKPILFDYAGKITSMNPGVLAGLQQNEKKLSLTPYFDEIDKIVDDMPRHFKKELNKKLDALEEATKAKPITNLDINKIKAVVQKLYPPSVWKAFGINRELKGMKRRGKELMPLILGGAIIIGLVAITIVSIIVLGG